MENNIVWSAKLKALSLNKCIDKTLARFVNKREDPMNNIIRKGT